MFTVLFDTWARLGFFRFGAPGRRGFGGGIERGFARRVSRVAFVLLMLLNVNFDGLLATPQWQNDVLRRLPAPYDVPDSSQHYFNTLAFAGLAVMLALILLVFAYSSAIAGQHRTTPLESFTGLLPSLVPIAFGYLLAHNLEYVLVNGQLLFPLIGNPPGLSSWPLHLPFPFNDSYEVHHSFLPSGFYWYASLIVIIAVHVYAVVLAHRHLVRVGETPALRLRSEYPWLAAMVGYTCLSLWLLAQPLTETTSTTSGLGPATPAHPPRSGTVVAAGLVQQILR
jgi:ABC-type Fe3+ transport system permease subunit